MNVLPKTVSSHVVTASAHTSNNSDAQLDSPQNLQKDLQKNTNKGVVTTSALFCLIAASSVLLDAQTALAQSAPAGTVHYDATSGAVQIDNNAFDIRTGAFENDSNIPLPDGLPVERPTLHQERVALPRVELFFFPTPMARSTRLVAQTLSDRW